MEFAAWEPIYESIAADFGYDPAGDRRARDELHERVTAFDFDRLDFRGRSVSVAGGSDSLGGELDDVRTADRRIGVSGAAAVLADAGIEPDLIVTDLDTTPERAIELSRRGVPVAVHAHGDNIPAIEKYVPQFDGEFVLGTTQVEPTDRVYNVGGFTDGDRAAFLADHLGARTLSFPGWNFEDPSVGPEKARKLTWAARLLRCLERRRGEELAVLDGHREGFSTLPDDSGWPCD
ncbi:MAG: 6-hydroxymethylpterin diphosphokinase MptE-like protein [Halodesulfurarchaeum sp.]